MPPRLGRVHASLPVPRLHGYSSPSHGRMPLLASPGQIARISPASLRPADTACPAGRRGFHEYFVTHLPSQSVHPDSQPKPSLSKAASGPDISPPGSSLAAPLPIHRDLTVVRIPLRRAKHHFGVASARGSRPYNEDAIQAGTLDIPAFAKRLPLNLLVTSKPGEARPANGAFGDPQIFYFGIFDGHGGTECSQFLKDELHGYIEEAASELGLWSSLQNHPQQPSSACATSLTEDQDQSPRSAQQESSSSETASSSHEAQEPELEQATTSSDGVDACRLQENILTEYEHMVGGYFDQPHPDLFHSSRSPMETPSAESVLTYAFLRADLDFVTAQAQKTDENDTKCADNLRSSSDIAGQQHQPPSGHSIGGPTRFQGGSTASVAIISTPTPSPFWNSDTSSALLVAHVGDSRILICDTKTGSALPLTSNHHPSSAAESKRLKRFFPSYKVGGDCFGEQRIMGLANSRAFGDWKSKHVGISAEPELTRLELGPAQYSFLVLMSDGVSGTVTDQEVVDIIKEADTPDEGALRVVDYATTVSADGDNATCLVVRLGGWERRREGGVGSGSTKEVRDARLRDAQDPRRCCR